MKTLVWSERPSAAAAGIERAIVIRRARGLNRARRGLQLAQGEFKSVDTAISQVIDQTGAVTLVNGIARGDEIFERNGREVVMKSIEFHCRCYATAGTGADQIGRILIVYDRQTNGAALTGAQVLDSFNTVAARNLENRRRFKILYDRRFVINASGEPQSAKLFNFYRRLAHPVTFNSGDAATVADIMTGSLYLLSVGTNVAGATAGSCVGTVRIRYQDK